MNRHPLRRWASSLGVLAAYLAFVWIAQPFIHSVRHLCPVRPDGTPQALAVPAFARKYGLSCMQCHAGFPVLNAYGRQFKLNGYVREPGSEEGTLRSEDKELSIEKVFPWALIVRSRPVDSGKGGVSSQGAQMGSTKSPNPNGFQSQPINDVDFFVAGGDAARRVSFFGEMDAGMAGGFVPGLGDLRLGYHPSQYYNFVVMRRNFFIDDPYQTITSAESPTISNRATDLAMANQASLSGNTMNGMQQTMAVYGKFLLPHNSDSFSSPAFIYYAVGATKDSDAGKQATSPTNANARLAFDSGMGLMVGTFGSYGEERAASAGANAIGGNLGVDAKVGEVEHFERGGFDALYEIGDFAARGAFVYSRDTDKVAVIADRNRAAYAELAYYYKRGSAAYPFLVPLVRENWYTTYNGSQQFNYVTGQLAHYFAPNVKGFVEYSADTKTDLQGGNLGDPNLGGTLARLQRGNRTTLQFEVGF